MLRKEIGAHRLQIGARHIEQAVGAVIAQAQQRFGPVRLRQVGARIRLHGGERILELRHGVGRERQGKRAFPHCPPVGQPHAIGRQHAAQRMDHHPVHAEGVGHEAGMLPAGAAKAGQGIARHIMPARDRDALDGVGHVGDGDGNKALRRLTRSHGAARFCLDLFAEGSEAPLDHVAIERLVAIGSEQAGKEVRLDLPQQDIAIGDGERPATPVAGRPGHRARAFRPDAKTPVDKGAKRTAARRDRVDPHHRRAQADAGHPRLIVPFIAAGIMGNISRRTAHVETDDLAETRLLGRARQADDAARRSRQDGVLPPEQRSGGQAAIGLHEQHVGLPTKRLMQPLHIIAQHGREIGVGQRGVAPAHQFDERRDIVASADLGKADIGGDLRQSLFMRRVAIAMHQQDGDGAQSLVIGRLQRGARGRFVQRHAHLAVGTHSFVDFDDIVMQGIGQADMAREQVRAFLRADADGVAKAARDGKQDRFALALQQGIGRDGRANPQRTGRNRAVARARQPADRFDGGIGIAFGIARKQLCRVQPPLRVARYYIGKSAAAVDPEMPGHGGVMAARAGYGKVDGDGRVCGQNSCCADQTISIILDIWIRNRPYPRWGRLLRGRALMRSGCWCVMSQRAWRRATSRGNWMCRKTVCPRTWGFWRGPGWFARSATAASSSIAPIWTGCARSPCSFSRIAAPDAPSFARR